MTNVSRIASPMLERNGPPNRRAGRPRSSSAHDNAMIRPKAATSNHSSSRADLFFCVPIASLLGVMIAAGSGESPRLSFRHGLFLRPGFRLRLWLDAFRKSGRSGRAIPLFESLVGDLARDEELRELPPLGLALERHVFLTCPGMAPLRAALPRPWPWLREWRTGSNPGRRIPRRWWERSRRARRPRCPGSETNAARPGEC